MSARTTNAAPRTGLRVDTLLTAAEVGGDTFQTGSGVFLLARNTSGGALDIVLATPGTVDGDLAVADRTFSVPATTGIFAIPLGDVYRNSATGRAAATYPGGIAAGALTVAAIRVPV